MRFCNKEAPGKTTGPSPWVEVQSLQPQMQHVLRALAMVALLRPRHKPAFLRPSSMDLTRHRVALRYPGRGSQ